MNHIIIYILIIFLSGCTAVPITHRKQLSLVSENVLIQSSELAYDNFLQENNVVNPYNQNSILLNEVGNKLAKACKEFLKYHGDIERVAGFSWEFNLIEGAEQNAWCMPGGKVAVYTGLLDITQDELGLAVVLSHEIAHAIARHGNERVSQQMVASYGSDLLIAILGNTDAKHLNLEQVITNTFDLGSQIGLLSFSRNHETEADKMGLVFMEYAGYDSQYAIEFWKRMAEEDNSEMPVFMSTHPTDEKRIAEIELFIPVAKSYIY